jgi:hypothetical protein
VLAAVIALAFILPLGRKISRRLLLVVGWVAAGSLLLYGGLGWLQAAFWETGVHDIPASVGAKAAWWKLIFWDPFWLLGGVLFLLAVWQFQKSAADISRVARRDNALARASLPALGDDSCVRVSA